MSRSTFSSARSRSEAALRSGDPDLIGALLFAAIAWLTAVEALDSMHRISNMMRWPHYPFQLTVAFGSAMYALVLLIQILRLIRRRRCGPRNMSRGDIIGLIGIAVLLLLMACACRSASPCCWSASWDSRCSTASCRARSARHLSLQYAAVYDFAVIPLFVLMGNLGSVSGMARDLYSAAYSWIGHVRGGLAHRPS